MLVLSRKLNQRVEIFVPASDVPQVISVQLCEVRNTSSARIGFEAKCRDVVFVRSELLKQDAGKCKTVPEPGD